MICSSTPLLFEWYFKGLTNRTATDLSDGFQVVENCFYVVFYVLKSKGKALYDTIQAMLIAKGKLWKAGCPEAIRLVNVCIVAYLNWLV